VSTGTQIQIKRKKESGLKEERKREVRRE